MVSAVAMATIAVIIFRNGSGHTSEQKLSSAPSDQRPASHSLGDKLKTAAEISGGTVQSLPWGVLRARERLNLSDKEVTILSENYQQMLTALEQIELRSAKREVLSEKVVLITIPQYSVDGAMLYSDFGKKLAEDLGIPRCREILQELDPVFRAANHDFGAADQQLLVEDKGAEIKITHGSGSVITANNQKTFVSVSSSSQLRPGHLAKYEYMAPLFPASYGPPGGGP